MKFAKLYTVLACAAALGTMASCSDVTEPVLQTPDPAQFKLNTPPFQNEYYKLTEDGTFDLTLNGQPSYGFSAVTQYRVQVALAADFSNEANYRELTPVGTGTQTRMTFNDLDLAEAICELRGITEESEYTDLGEQTVYFRGVAFIDGIDRSYVTTSNVVSLNRVQSFFSVAKPGKIYVIGNYAGSWISPEASKAEALEPYTLSEKDDAIRSKVYYGSVEFSDSFEDIANNGCIFRFYTALTGWDEDSVGCAGGTDSDTPVEFPEFAAGTTLEHAVAATKDSFKFNNYSGKLEFVVNINTMQATITAPAQ